MTYPGVFAASTPDKVALVLAGSGETMTYRELNERANRIGRALLVRGLEKEGVVAVSRNATSTGWLACLRSSRPAVSTFPWSHISRPIGFPAC